MAGDLLNSWLASLMIAMFAATVSDGVFEGRDKSLSNEFTR
jgi:hypothetical protein